MPSATNCPTAVRCSCDIAAGVQGPFDLIVSNPPYVRMATSLARAGGARLRPGDLPLMAARMVWMVYRAIANEPLACWRRAAA